MILLTASAAGLAQWPRNEEPPPATVRESMEKLRIEQSKKEYREMMERGEEALRLSEQLERDFEVRGRLTESEMEKAVALEKIVKKIRSELGGDGDGEDEAKSLATLPSPGDAIKTLRTSVVSLYDELKKTTRFTISAAAIESSNAAIKFARILRITK